MYFYLKLALKYIKVWKLIDDQQCLRRKCLYMHATDRDSVQGVCPLRRTCLYMHATDRDNVQGVRLS